MTASTRENLVKLQVMANRLNGRAYNYRSVKEGKEHVVYFFADWQNHIYITEKDLDDMLPVGKTLTEMTQESK